MVQRHSSAVILLDDREGRAVYRLRDPESLSKTLRKNCFSDAEIAVQADHFARLCLFPKHFSKGEGLLRCVCFFYHAFNPFVFFGGRFRLQKSTNSCFLPSMDRNGTRYPFVGPTLMIYMFGIRTTFQT